MKILIIGNSFATKYNIINRRLKGNRVIDTKEVGLKNFLVSI